MKKEERDPHHLRSQIRLPADLASTLKQRGLSNTRTFNAEVVHRLKVSVQQEDEATKGEAQAGESARASRTPATR